MEEYELMKQAKYRGYMSNIDKALKNFEYSSEWADLISALGKLNKVISGYPQYQIIPRRIKISKRLAQCMHPALPSGVHLKALETYDIIFSNTGVERLASELFIYSAGLFPLLGYAAMNVRPTLLGIYEKYFVPLGERLRPALSGFLSGVLPGYESGLDHFDRTNSLLTQVCTAVSPIYFYTCMWECVATNASIRLPAVSYLIDHFNKRIGMDGQKYVMGKNQEVMMSGLCACLNDSVILVQRNTLEFLLLGFPLHTGLLSNCDLIRLVTNGLNTILRRDMSLNRRLYAWLLGTEVTNKNNSDKSTTSTTSSNTTAGNSASTSSSTTQSEEVNGIGVSGGNAGGGASNGSSSTKRDTYFNQYSKPVLIKALRCTLKLSLQCTPVDLSPYRILVSLLDKVEIGPVVLDDVLCDVIRTMALTSGISEVGKSANLLFATFDPAYIWNFMTQLYEKSCKLANGSSRLTLDLKNTTQPVKFQPEVDSGPPSLVEVCFLTEFLLETISLEMYNETKRVYLPKVFLAITQMLTIYSELLSNDDVTASLKLCMKIVSRIQPMGYPSSHVGGTGLDKEPGTNRSDKNLPIEGNALEKSKSDSKINQTLLEDEPMKRSNSNQSMSKKSPKKTKKSKSYSKLQELDKDICSDSGQLVIPNAVSTPNLEQQQQSSGGSSRIKFLKHGKKSPKLKQNKSQNDIKLNDSGECGELTSLETETGSTTSPDSLEPIPHTLTKSARLETTAQEYSILEKCIKQYEIFYQVFVSQQILGFGRGDGGGKSSETKRSSKCNVRVTIITDESPTNGSTTSDICVNENIVEDRDYERINEIDRIFETLKVNVNCRQSRLYSLLNKTISQSGSSGDLSENETSTDGTFRNNPDDVKDCDETVYRLMELKYSDRLREATKLASNLLVEMSTFPNYNQNLVIDYTDCDIPTWLKVLSLVACYTHNDKELQISAISTMFELVSLLKSQMEHSTNPGVTYVVILPLLKFGHVNFLEKKTRIFQLLTSSLWNYLGDRSTDLHQISSLLYQLNNCLESGLVETVIGHRIASTHQEWQNSGESFDAKPRNYISFDTSSSVQTKRLPDYTSDRLYDVKIMCLPPANTVSNCGDYLSESQFMGFKKFELLWHLGRDFQNSSGFDKTLLKMFDKLALPYHNSIRIFVTKWLQESYVRGDLSRLLRPLLKIVLAPNTKKISIVHANSLRKLDGQLSADGTDNKGTEDDEEVILGKDIYAVRNDDGNVSYHVETPPSKKRSSPIRSLQKKFFGVAIGSKNKTSNYVESKSSSVSITESLITSTNNSANISLIINPLDNSVDILETQIAVEHEQRERSLSGSIPSQTTNDHEDSRMISFKEDFYSSNDDDESLESSADSDSGKSDKDDSVVTNPSLTSIDDVKRFVGNYNELSDIMTEHDRTKNKKTYRLAKKFNTDTASEGLNSLEESTPAEEYFSSSSATELIIENVMNDLIMEAVETVDDEDVKRRAKKPSNRRKAEEHKKSRHSTGNIVESQHLKKSTDSKRLSCASKTSSSSSNSHSSDSKESDYEPDMFTERATSAQEDVISTNGGSGGATNHIDVSKLVKNLENSQRLSNESKKINWEKAKEQFDKVKNNVEILRQNSGRDESTGDDKFKLYEKIHPFHSHMLLYSEVYDTKQVLYAFQTLRNIISCNCRSFLCLSITTSVANNHIKQLLVRHKKSISGKGFTGTIVNTEFSHAYRGCMYLEALVTICLYYARGYFQKEVRDKNDLPTTEDIHGNHQIQMASIELLTLLCTELITVIKDTGKALACYIADLMVKCKLQKIILHCVILSVHSMNKSNGMTFSEQILRFNDTENERLYTESYQIQLLRLLLAVIKLEYEVTMQKLDDASKGFTMIETNPSSYSPTRASPSTPVNVKYLPNCMISQQPLFLSAILSALQADNLKHLHRNWTDLVTSSLSCLNFGSLTNIVISVVHQICSNIDKITRTGRMMIQPPDYAVSQLEALTVLCHFCLLDNTQQSSLSHMFNQTYPQMNSTSSTSTHQQIFNNLVHVFQSTPGSNENQTRNAQHMAARNAVLSHLPRIVASVAALWENEVGQTQVVKHQLLEFLSPVSLHHGVNFLGAIAVAWQERGDNYRRGNGCTGRKDSLTTTITTLSHKALPQACPDQLILVRLVSGIRVMPMDSFVQTLHQVVKTPPPIHHSPPGLVLEVSALELFYFYMKEAPAAQLSDCWSSLLALMRDGLNLSPPAQFVLLTILNEFVQRCPQMPFQDKKDLRDLHDITSRLVEALSQIAGACLEQTTWLRRNLAVKEDVGHVDGHIREGHIILGNQQFSVQAQSVLAVVLANLLDIAYGSQEKDKVVTIVTTLMGNIVPYLKNHTSRNIPSFYACSHLLASLSGYQYTRKAWRKDLLDLLLDPTFFQMDNSCLPFWKSILDSLMTYDNTTFRELMNRVSLAQTGSLNIFTSKEQEYEQRALLLKRLAFVIFCSELDQYHKYMPEIQEQLANSLRLPQVVPSVQAAVFLCFRVLLLRMSPDHVTSLWPIIIAEMVQVFLAIEQELMTDTEEYSQHIKMLSGLDTAWVTNTSNGLHSHGHPHWRMVQLETSKLLELGCVLPATVLPHFQMYRWAFVGGKFEGIEGGEMNGHVDGDGGGGHKTPSIFVPHVSRIARLMDFRYKTNSPKDNSKATTSGSVTASLPIIVKKTEHLVLKCQTISNLQDLYPFFSTIGTSWVLFSGDAEKDISNCLAEIELVLASDFLEKMPAIGSAR